MLPEDKLLISKIKKIYYIFSSITYLQLYISLVIEFSNLNYKNIFIIKESKKKRKCCPIHNIKNSELLNKYKNEYNFETINYNNNINKIKNLEGIVFMVDGDVYGAHEKHKKTSILNILNKKSTLKISLIEHINFRKTYEYYIDDVDYCIFSNINLPKQYNKISNKNLFLGNTKFDNIITKKLIYRKYNLDDKKKYCLLLYPKNFFFNKTKTIKYDYLDKIYMYLSKLGYDIIVKTRPKDNNILDKHKGILTVCSNHYPNESLELMKISELCVIFGSSANEEALYMKIPCIDFKMDNNSRNTYLLNDKIYIQIDNLENITFEEFKNIYNNLEKKNSNIFSEFKNKYLFDHKNSAKQYIKFLNKNKYIID